MQLTIIISLAKERKKCNFFGHGQDLLSLAYPKDSPGSEVKAATSKSQRKPQNPSWFSIRAWEIEPPSPAEGQLVPGFSSWKSAPQVVLLPEAPAAAFSSYFPFSVIPHPCQAVCSLRAVGTYPMSQAAPNPHQSEVLRLF